MEARQNELVIILADISGYTRFMMQDQLSAVHGQMCITFLIETLLREVDIPLRLQEIEGDAVFLYAENPGDDAQWQRALAEIREKLIRFFKVFYDAIVTGAEITPCECAVCANADDLHLKIVVHSGCAVFHEIAGRPQVSGPDVILAHRLLKNSIRDDEYLLMSEAAYRAVGAQMDRDFIQDRERYDSIGEVATYVHFLNEDAEGVRAALYALDQDHLRRRVRQRMSQALREQTAAAWQHLRHPMHPVGLLRRIGFVLWLFLVTPFHLPREVRRIREKVRKRREAYQGRPHTP